MLSKGLDKREAIAVASGGFADIWKGDLRGARVSIMAFRICPAQNLKETEEVSIKSACRVYAHERNPQILWRRLLSWKRLSHPNILAFRGVNVTLFPLYLVYDRGYHGNIIQYLASHPQVSRPSLVCGFPAIFATKDAC